MANENGISELYKKHRPVRFKDILGQSEAIASLQVMLKENRLPHALLLSGSSGIGKTTIARILKAKLHCADHDFFEINCASLESASGMVRDIGSHMSLSPMGGDCRIWLLDEVQSLSRAGFAQQGLLKILEDTPSHCYFLLCTTDPTKIIPTIRTRCTEIKLKPLGTNELIQLLENVCQKEKGDGQYPPKDLVGKIAELAEGSARKALVLLHQIINLATVEEQWAVLQSEDTQKQAIDLCRALFNQHNKWEDIRKILETLQGEPEEIRRAVLGYAASVLLKGGKQDRAFVVLSCFESNWFDSGRNGLIRACYEVFRNKD